MLEPQELPRQGAVGPGQRLKPGRGFGPGPEGAVLQGAAPILPQRGRDQGQVAAGVVHHVGLGIVQQRLRVAGVETGQVPPALAQKLEFIGRLGHEKQNVGMIALQRRRKSAPRRRLPTQFRHTGDGEAAPIGMGQLVHHRDRTGFPDPGPTVEPVAAEKPRLAPHPAQVQAAEQRRPLPGKAVKPDNRVQPLHRPRRVAGMGSRENGGGRDRFPRVAGGQQQADNQRIERQDAQAHRREIFPVETPRPPANQISAPAKRAISTKPPSASDQSNRAAATTRLPSMPTTSCCTG